jgi:hypothetical protein
VREGRGAGPGQGERGVSCVRQSFGFLQLSLPAKNIYTHTDTHTNTYNSHGEEDFIQ